MLLPLLPDRVHWSGWKVIWFPGDDDTGRNGAELGETSAGCRNQLLVAEQGLWQEPLHNPPDSALPREERGVC